VEGVEPSFSQPIDQLQDRLERKKPAARIEHESTVSEHGGAMGVNGNAAERQR